ncbi:MAG: response regulator [Planctomycetia bacterium]|nr:response regulator [Planctomycetia bacterium]
MIASRSLWKAASAAVAKWTADRRTPANPSMILVVENRDDFFVGLAQVVASMGVRVERAAGAAEATRRLQREEPDLILANCELPDESGWLMVSKWCLTRMPKRVWLYQARPAVFDHNWIELTKVERILYYGDDVLGLANQVRNKLAEERRWSPQAA